MFTTRLLWSQRQLRIGITNLGNTCYMNSVLQALYCCSEFTDVVLSRRFKLNDRPAAMVTLLRQLLGSFAFGYKPCAVPSAFHRSLPEPFNGYAQQDATEFLRLLLDALDKACDAPSKAQVCARIYRTLITRIIDFVFACYCCLRCLCSWSLCLVGLARPW